MRMQCAGGAHSSAQEPRLITVATPITVAAVSKTVGTMTQISLTVSMEIPLECGAGEDARCGDDDVVRCSKASIPPAIEGRLLDPAGQLRADKTSLTVSRGAESL